MKQKSDEILKTQSFLSQPLLENKEIKKLSRFGHLRSSWLAVLIVSVLTLGVLGSTLKYLDEDAKAQLAKRSAATPLKPHEEPLLLSLIHI